MDHEITSMTSEGNSYHIKKKRDLLDTMLQILEIHFLFHGFRGFGINIFKYF